MEREDSIWSSCVENLVPAPSDVHGGRVESLGSSADRFLYLSRFSNLVCSPFPFLVVQPTKVIVQLSGSFSVFSPHFRLKRSCQPVRTDGTSVPGLLQRCAHTSLSKPSCYVRLCRGGKFNPENNCLQDMSSCPLDPDRFSSSHLSPICTARRAFHMA